MLTKPFAEMDQSELQAVVASAGPEVAAAKQSAQAALDRLKNALWVHSRAGAALRDRFGIDPKTGKRLGRKRRTLLDLTG